MTDRSKTTIIHDDLEADCPVKPGDREKISEHFAATIGSFDLPSAVLLDQSPTLANAKAAAEAAGFQINICGPSTSPCGPSRDDHTWDDDVEFTAGQGRVIGGSVACSRCGITAMDFDIWNAE